jgi:hypothetical protein
MFYSDFVKFESLHRELEIVIDYDSYMKEQKWFESNEK